MALRISVPPTIEPVSVSEAALHCRIDMDDDNALLANLIVAAREMAEGFQNRAYLTQTWELWLDAFPFDEYIKIPLPPLQSITSIKYYDTAGVEATFAAASYYVSTTDEPGFVMLNSGYSWPTTLLRPANGVCITFVAGKTTAALLPARVKQAILLLVGHLYEHRESTTTQQFIKELPMAVSSMLWLDRIM